MLDGTRVSLVHRKGFQKDGTVPLFQYAYRSYGASTDPMFRSSVVSLLDRGFVYAIAHIRGGQEMGRAWYKDGKKLKKRDTFNDFADVTEALVQQKYAAKDKVFAQGGSAGGQYAPGPVPRHSCGCTLCGCGDHHAGRIDSTDHQRV